MPSHGKDRTSPEQVETEKPIDQGLYRTRIREARAGGNYFIVFTPYFRIMSKLDALFIQHLVNLASMVADQSTGWFPCPDSVLERGGWSKKEIEIRLRSLRGGDEPGDGETRAAWIKTERRGLPSMRWVWIDNDAIDEALDRTRETGATTHPRSGVSEDPRSGVTNEGKRTKSSQTLKQSVPNPPCGLRDGVCGPGSGTSTQPDPVPPVKSPTASDKGQKPAKRGDSPFDMPEPEKGPVPGDSEVRANRLRQIVVDHTNHAAPWKRSAWAAEFAKLARDLAGDWARIDRALENFASVIGEEYVPVIQSATAFREKFDKLEAAIKRLQPREPVPEKLHPETPNVLKYAQRLHWPKGSSADLPAAVSRSLTRFEKFVAALETAELSSDAKLIRTRIDKNTRGPADEITAWFEAANRRAADWDGWSGDLKGMEWRPDHKRFVATVNAWVQDYTSFPMEPDAWAEILKSTKGV